MENSESTVVIPTLENLAFEASYQYIVNNLNLCNDAPPEEEDWFSSLHHSKTRSPTSETMITFIRNQLAQILCGIMSDQTRQKYAQQFHASLDQEGLCGCVDPCLFLACILDGSFEEVKTAVSVPFGIPNPKLISTIANYSSQLKKLKLNFSEANYGGGASMSKLGPLISPLNSLQNLTHLCVKNLDEAMSKEFISVLSLIGTYCPPSLTHLKVIGNNIGKKEMLALFLGELVSSLLPSRRGKEPAWLNDSELKRLIAPSQYLTPLCFSLEEFDFIPVDFVGVKLDRSALTSESIATFALRHLPRLKKMNKQIQGMGMAVMNLYEAKKFSKQQESFEDACQDAADHLGVIPPPRSTTPFSGSFMLTTLHYVDVSDEDMVRAVGSTCPLLEEVLFCQRHTTNPALVPEELESILKTWPKIHTASFVGVPSKYFKSVLKVLGPELTHLDLKSCYALNVNDIVPCSQLESLHVRSLTSFKAPEETDDVAKDADTFLPQLKSFKSSICMGFWSHLFEEKSTLVLLDVKCSHILVKLCNDLDPANQPVTKRIKYSEQDGSDNCKLWPRLEFLRLRERSGLTMTMVSTLISQLSKLKEIHLPEEMRSNELELSYTIRDQLLRQKPLIQLVFRDDSIPNCIPNYSRHFPKCSFVN